LKLVDTAESSIECNKVEKDKIHRWTLNKLNDKTIYNIDYTHSVAENPNSGLISVFTFDLLDKLDFDNKARLLVLMAMIKTPCFQTLRTKEQLGYIVGAASTSKLDVRHAQFTI